MGTTIGIDPGINTGWATAIDGKIAHVETMTFWDAVELLRGMHGSAFTVYIEDPSHNKPVFIRAGAKNKAMFGRIAQNVGSNKRDAQLLIEFCKRMKYDVRAVPPTKGFLSKMSDADFKRLTRYTRKTSQHGRDAAMLIFGRR